MKTFSVTDVGQRRKMNQDYVFASEYPVGPLPNLFIVADGMGGHNAGDYASRFVTNTIKELIENSDETDAIKLIDAAVQKSNVLLREEAVKKEELWGMGTTIVVTTIFDGTALTANVGDSRLYLIGDAGMKQITQDHSLVEEMVRLGQLTREEARMHPDKNIITRAIGASKTVQIDFFEYDLKARDTILMCSDGLTNMVEDSDIEAVVKNGAPIEERAMELIKAANDHGGKDNIAVVLVEPDTNEVKEC